jgi:hypothetical protein
LSVHGNKTQQLKSIDLHTRVKVEGHKGELAYGKPTIQQMTRKSALVSDLTYTAIGR